MMDLPIYLIVGLLVGWLTRTILRQRDFHRRRMAALDRLGIPPR